MKKFLKNMTAVGFLILFLPYTVTLLANGRQGIHQEEQLPELEYQVLYRLMQEDYSWMEDGTLELMAVLFRTEYVRGQAESVKEPSVYGLYEENYERSYQAVVHTKGQVITIDGTYRELPYHAVSAGVTRDGLLLGGEFAYVNSVECREDREAESYLQICSLTEEELKEALKSDEDILPEDLVLERDPSEYVTQVKSSSKSWTGENFRSLLHLASSCFYIEPQQGGIRIISKGSGHGFGISLYTANRSIRDGADKIDIIQKFYQNAECITIP